MGATLGEIIAGGVVLLYGSIWLLAAGVYTLLHRETWTGQNSEDRALLKQASHDLWSLSGPTGPIAHHFLRIPDGTQLHYLSPSRAPRSVNALVIFLHGFPDSSHIWARQLRVASPSDVKLVALDLPGCGGSDGLKIYGPDQVLNGLAEAITALRRKYLADESKQCILVTHDWGGAMGFRLAAETRGLFHRMVVLNSVYPRHAEAVFRARLGRARRAFVSWLANPSKIATLREVRLDLQPVLRQALLSNYIFLMIYPLPLARIFPSLSYCLVRYAHGMASRGLPPVTPSAAATSLAMSCGPSVLECATRTADGQTYGASVLRRAQTTMPGDWDERAALYRDGLGMGRWTPDYTGAPPAPPAVARGSGEDAPVQSHLLRVRPSWKFKYPVDIIFGMDDEALGPGIVLEDIESYFQVLPNGQTSSSTQGRVIKLAGSGHWSFLSDAGAEALDKTLSELVGRTGQ